MKKKIILFVAALLMAITAHAQFEEGKFYAGASLTGLNMSYSGADNLNLGVQGKLGYFFSDDLMLLGLIDFQMNSNALTPNRFMTGVGARYYIEQNGIFLGANTTLRTITTSCRELKWAMLSSSAARLPSNRLFITTKVSRTTANIPR